MKISLFIPGNLIIQQNLLQNIKNNVSGETVCQSSFLAKCNKLELQKSEVPNYIFLIAKKYFLSHNNY